jgi:hypothetical protein
MYCIHHKNKLWLLPEHLSRAQTMEEAKMLKLIWCIRRWLTHVDTSNNVPKLALLNTTCCRLKKARKITVVRIGRILQPQDIQIKGRVKQGQHLDSAWVTTPLGRSTPQIQRVVVRYRGEEKRWRWCGFMLLRHGRHLTLNMSTWLPTIVDNLTWPPRLGKQQHLMQD